MLRIPLLEDCELRALSLAWFWWHLRVGLIHDEIFDMLLQQGQFELQADNRNQEKPNMI
jgi:hypothetical protein